MRKFLTTLSTAALLATPVMAEARGFDSDFSNTIVGPIKLEIVVSEDLAHRANNLPKKMSDRGSRSRLSGTFSNNGHYGEREITYLLEEMEEEISDDFAKYGITISDNAPTVLRITIEDVRPNRPTFNQLSKDSSLSFKSVSTGGAEITATVSSAGGESLGQAEYDYFSSFNDRPNFGLGVWTDTNRAFSRFSKKLTKKLAALGAASS